MIDSPLGNLPQGFVCSTFQKKLLQFSMLISKQIIRRNILEKFSNKQTEKYLAFNIPNWFKETNYLQYFHIPQVNKKILSQIQMESRFLLNPFYMTQREKNVIDHGFYSLQMMLQVSIYSLVIIWQQEKYLSACSFCSILQKNLIRNIVIHCPEFEIHNFAFCNTPSIF